jgi:hypothetical protein
MFHSPVSHEGASTLAFKGQSMKDIIKGKMKLATVILTVLFSLALIQTSAGIQDPSTNQREIKDNVVYVCSCLKIKSCPCMTEAKTEGPCACGAGGGPPMKAVPGNSAWAKANREALAK